MNHYTDNEEIYEDYINQVMFEMTEEEIQKKKEKTRQEYEIMLLGWGPRNIPSAGQGGSSSKGNYEAMLLGRKS